MFCEENMCGKLVSESSCVSDSEEYSNSQPVAEPRAIPEERQRGTVILIRYSRGNSQGNYYSPIRFIEHMFYQTSVLSNWCSIYKKKTVALLYHMETFPVNTVHRHSIISPFSASYPRERIKFQTFAELILPLFF